MCFYQSIDQSKWEVFSSQSANSNEVCSKCGSTIYKGSIVYFAYSGGLFSSTRHYYCSKGCAKEDGHRDGTI